MTNQNAGRQAVIDTTRTIHFVQDVYGDDETGCPADLRGWFVMVSDPVAILRGEPEWEDLGGPFPTRADAEAHCREIYS